MKNRFLKILSSIILSFISVTLVGCSRQYVNDENIQIAQSEAEKSEQEIMFEKLIGCLSLNDDEKNEIFNMIEQIINIKKADVDSNNSDLDVLNNSISDILNKYTEEKIIPNEGDIDNIKRRFDVYKKGHDSINVTEYTPDVQIKESCSYDIINGEEIRKSSDLKMKNTSEFEKKSIEVWEYIKKILPRDALKNIDCLNTFSTKTQKGQETLGGSMSTFEDGKSVLSVNISLDFTYIPYILYHEYGHYLSLNKSQCDSKNNWDNYNQKYDDLKFKKDSYMQKFYDKFYKYIYNDMILDTSGYLFYLRHKNEFVGMYAASHYLEDFAESFACFVSDDYDEEGKEKVEFFNDFPEFVKFKKEAQYLLEVNGLTAKRVTR